MTAIHIALIVVVIIIALILFAWNRVWSISRLIMTGKVPPNQYSDLFTCCNNSSSTISYIQDEIVKRPVPLSTRVIAMLTASKCYYMNLFS